MFLLRPAAHEFIAGDTEGAFPGEQEDNEFTDMQSGTGIFSLLTRYSISDPSSAPELCDENSINDVCFGRFIIHKSYRLDENNFLTPVPSPTSFWLFASSSAGLGLARKNMFNSLAKSDDSSITF